MATVSEMKVFDFYNKEKDITFYNKYSFGNDFLLSA